MLFDLRSRGRRRTVQAVYLGLALLMGGGLVLFGVGAGNGFGGLLNGIGGTGGGGAQKQLLSQQEKDAQKATTSRPNDPLAWSALVSARVNSAGQGADYDVNTQAYTATGRKEAQAAGQAWQRYLTLTQKPDPDLARVVATRVYDPLADYADEARAWEIVTAANPTVATYFEYLAATAYRAKQTRKGDLAAAKALSLTPKAQRTLVKQQLQQAKTQAASKPATTTTAGK